MTNNKNIIIENDYLHMEILNPLNHTDSHFSSRYSHCGYIQQIINKKTNSFLLGSPTEQFNPFSGEGFPDEFEIPLGYCEADIGEQFIKIGVGREQKKTNTPYTNHDKHKITHYAKTLVLTTSKEATFKQLESLGDYGYQYTKRICLLEDKFTISHSLENMGRKQLNTLWYSHVFLPFKNEAEQAFLHIPKGYAYSNNNSIESCFDESFESFKKYRLIVPESEKKGVCYNWNIANEEMNIQRLRKEDKDFYISKGDYSLNELQVFINNRTISIEPKLTICLDTAKKIEWSTEYNIL